jgi:hypothetical protein
MHSSPQSWVTGPLPSSLLFISSSSSFLPSSLPKLSSSPSLPSTSSSVSSASFRLLTTSKGIGSVDFRDPSVYLRALQFRSALLLHQSAERLQENVGAGKDLFTAWNDSQVYFLQGLAKSYIEYQIVLRFHEWISSSVPNGPLKNALKELCDLFALTR